MVTAEQGAGGHAVAGGSGEKFDERLIRKVKWPGDFKASADQSKTQKSAAVMKSLRSTDKPKQSSKLSQSISATEITVARRQPVDALVSGPATPLSPNLHDTVGSLLNGNNSVNRRQSAAQPLHVRWNTLKSGIPEPLFPLPAEISQPLARIILAETRELLDGEDLRRLTKKSVVKRVNQVINKKLSASNTEGKKSQNRLENDYSEVKRSGIKVDLDSTEDGKRWLGLLIEGICLLTN